MNYVVIGAGFGDEGKGLITDHLVRNTSAKIVTRFNGGAQAGHTVNDGTKSHVFGHVSAGTFAGADTYLSSHFIVNPYVLNKEVQQLKKLGFNPTIHVSSIAYVTTIYDMVVNAVVEQSRGNSRHGSCGLGINETVTRNESGFILDAGDIAKRGMKRLVEALKIIHTEWVPERLQSLGIDMLPSDLDPKITSLLYDDNYEHHAQQLINVFSHLSVVSGSGIHIGGSAILEGAQGLMLDEILGDFPHVTRSMTGLPYALNAAFEMCLPALQPVYVARAYATRHGAGPFKHEGEHITNCPLYDVTNIHNEWQGTLRYAPLDLAELKRFIDADLARGRELAPDYDIKLLAPTLAVTCLDQLSDQVVMYDVNGQKCNIARENVTKFIANQLVTTVTFESWGPTSKDVRTHQTGV